MPNRVIVLRHVPPGMAPMKYSVITEPVDDGYALVARPAAGICPLCLHPTQFLERPREVKTKAGRIVSFELTFEECTHCEETFLSPADVDELLRRAADADEDAHQLETT